MARTIKEISNGMKAEFVRDTNLRTAFGIATDVSEMTDEQLVTVYDSNLSAVNVVTLLIYIVAACAAAIENMLDWHIADVNEMVDGERYGQTGWYAKVAKKFQYQHGTDFQLDENTGEYGTVNDTYKIIKHASCENNGFGVKLKVAKEIVNNSGELSSDEKTAFAAYINRVKPAGIPVTIISRSADVLKVSMTVYYDPTIFNANGAVNKVKEMINEYIQDIDFNGEFITMKMVDRLQEVSGLDIIEVSKVEASTDSGSTYMNTDYNARYTPAAGYMTLDNSSTITVIANV